MSAELRGLLEGCKAEPGELHRRLVLADWLDDHGQTPVAGCVRLSCQESAVGGLAGCVAGARALLGWRPGEWAPFEVGGLGISEEVREGLERMTWGGEWA